MMLYKTAIAAIKATKGQANKHPVLVKKFNVQNLDRIIRMKNMLQVSIRF